MATIFNQGTLTFTPLGGEQASVQSNTTGTELDVSYGIEISHGAAPETYIEGDTIRYTVVVRNTGNGTLADPVVTVDLAGGALDYVEGSAVAFLYDGSDVTEYPITVSENGTLVFTLSGDLPAGAAAYIVYSAVVDQSDLAREDVRCELVSTATVVAHEGTVDGPAITDSDTATIRCTPITIVKSAPETASVGDTISFVFTITNNTGASVGLDRLTDQLPAQFSLTAVSVTNDGIETPLTEGSDYTVTDGGLLTVTPAGTFVLAAGETVLLTVTGVITA